MKGLYVAVGICMDFLFLKLKSNYSDKESKFILEFVVKVS